MTNCPSCGVETSNPKFCSRSCAAKLNNRTSPKRQKMYGRTGICEDCGCKVQNASRRCIPCQKARKGAKPLQAWLDGEWDGGIPSTGELSDIIRNHLRSLNPCCSKCGWAEVHPKTGRVPLEVNHIDGDSWNHSPENLEVICPNCHSLTETYRGLNKSNGSRTWRSKYPNYRDKKMRD